MNVLTSHLQTEVSENDSGSVRKKVGAVVLTVSSLLGSGCTTTGGMFPPDCHTTRTVSRNSQGETERVHQRCERFYYQDGNRCRELNTIQIINGEVTREGSRTSCEPIFRRYY